MTPPENENAKPLWNESDVEALLEDFFQKEMPADLRSESPTLPPRGRMPRTATSPTLESTVPAGSSRTGSRPVAGVLMVGVSSLLLVMMAVLYWNPVPPLPGGKSTAGPRSEETPAERDQPDRDHPDGDVLKALRHNGQGPIESRPRIRSVGQGKPGEAMEFPELDVEVFPLDRNFSNPEHPEDRQPPEEKSPLPEKSPMPEEGRQLPENRPPETDDPDEVDDASLLPELEVQPLDPLSI